LHRPPMRLPMLTLCFLLGACNTERESPPSWQIVHRDLEGALLSVWGTSASDVWTVGSDSRDGQGPLVLHFDGTSWERVLTGQTGDLWWVFGFDTGELFLGGEGGTILRKDGDNFVRMPTPSTSTVFGIWGASPDAVWAVGGQTGGASGAFAWRLDGDEWTAAEGFPADLPRGDALWKVFGQGPDDVWMVGTGGKTLHYDGDSLTEGFTGHAESLFTVHSNGRRFAAVGGFASGLILERDVAAAPDSSWTDVSPKDALALSGVCLSDTGGYAVGQFGYIAARSAGGWHAEDTGFERDFGTRGLHSVWIDPDGGAWAVGGQVLEEPLLDGILLHRGAAVAATRTPAP
jgi:hypothetical protein